MRPTSTFLYTNLSERMYKIYLKCYRSSLRHFFQLTSSESNPSRWLLCLKNIFFFPTAITSKLYLSSSSLSSITKVSTVSTVYLQHNQGFYCLPGEDFVVQLSPARAHRHMSGKQIFENLSALLMD